MAQFGLALEATVTRLPGLQLQIQYFYGSASEARSHLVITFFASFSILVFRLFPQKQSINHSNYQFWPFYNFKSHIRSNFIKFDQTYQILVKLVKICQSLPKLVRTVKICPNLSKSNKTCQIRPNFSNFDQTCQYQIKLVKF